MLFWLTLWPQAEAWLPDLPLSVMLNGKGSFKPGATKGIILTEKILCLGGKRRPAMMRKMTSVWLGFWRLCIPELSLSLTRGKRTMTFLPTYTWVIMWQSPEAHSRQKSDIRIRQKRKETFKHICVAGYRVQFRVAFFFPFMSLFSIIYFLHKTNDWKLFPRKEN